MFKVFLGFVLALVIAFVIRVVYDMGRRKEALRAQRILTQISEVMSEVKKEVEAEEARRTVRKKKK